MNAVGQNLWLECISSLRDGSSLLDDADNSITDIVALEQQLGGEGFNHLNASDIEVLLQLHNTELTTDELIQLNQKTTRNRESTWSVYNSYH